MKKALAARLRALPLAVLVTVVVVAVLVRARRESSPDGPPAVATVTSSSDTDAALATGLDAPLRAMPGAVPLDAEVPDGGPRMLHGGPRHTHRVAARGPRAAKVGWRVNAGGPVATQVTVSPDARTLYAGTLDGSLVAISREDGAKRWSVPLGDRVYSTPIISDDGMIYVGTDAKKLVAITPEGTVSWRLEVEGEADTAPAFGKDGTIVFAAGKDVYAVRRRGDLAWRYTTKGKVFTAPAITGDGLVIVGAQDDHVHAITPQGTRAWSVDLGADVDGAAVISDDGSITVGTDRGEIVRLDPTGTILWRTVVAGFVRGALSLARNGDVLAGTYGPVPRVVRVAPDGTIRGAFAIKGTGAREFGIHGGPLEDAEGTLYFGTQDDAVYAVGPDGAVRWRFDTGADVDAPLTMLDDGSLVVASEDGTITMLLP